MVEQNYDTIALVSDLLGGLRHELGNLMTVLSLDVDLLDRTFSNDTGDRGWLVELRQNLSDLNTLLTRLRTYPQPGGTHTQFDLNQAILNAAEYSRRIDMPPIDYTLSDEPIWVTGDESGIVRVLCNIIENAIEASPTDAQAEIQVDIETTDQTVSISVIDRGHGFTEQELREGLPFLPGYTTKINDGFMRGLGLGLFVSRAVLALHDGTIELHNRAGGGAVATIRLPRATSLEGSMSDQRY